VSTKTNFTINNKKFAFEKASKKNGGFLIKSAPKPYTLSFCDKKKPFKTIQNLLKQPDTLLLIDKKVFDLYTNDFAVEPQKILKISATEKFKTLKGITRVMDFLQNKNLSKTGTLIVVGGGITQDVGAFVSACYRRGIKWIYFPTTLLSMSDSCLGGKTGINYNESKNQIGLFSAPKEILINTHFLKTLRVTDIRSGLGEILKLLLIGGKASLKFYTKYVKQGQVAHFEDYKKLILQALLIKKPIVEIDEFELNHRKSLNYGHTLGHAIESLSEFAIPHGQAVVLGVILANELSNRRQLIDTKTKNRINKLCFDLLDNNIIKIMRGLNLKKLPALLEKDKKTDGKMLNLIMISSLGKIDFLKVKPTSSLFTEVSDIIKRCF